MKRTSYINIWLLAVMLGMFYSCTKSLPLPEIKRDNKIVLLGELVAGEPCYLRAGQSVAVTGSNVGGLKFQILNDLAITVTDSAGHLYNMKGQADDFTQTLYTIPFTMDTRAAEGNVYTINATQSSLGTVTAKVHIPAQISAEVLDTASTLYAADNTLKIKVRLKDPGNATNYYVIEALKQVMNITGYFFYDNSWHAIADDSVLYKQLKESGNAVTRFDTSFQPGYLRQAIYTADPHSENVANSGALTRSRRVLIKDAAFNGTDYETTVYVVREAPDSIIDQRGRVIIYIKSVSEDYFKFLRSYEVFLPTLDYGSMDQPVKIQGNVQNGYGMVGGVSQVKFTYIYDTWNF